MKHRNEEHAAPIEDALMGDVWPVVEPGAADRDYGSARLESPPRCEIRSFQTLTITYTVGKFGLDDTGAIRIAFRFVYDGGALQTTDPAAPNYVSARASNGAGLELYPEHYAYRPWLTALRITVRRGYMNEGDSIAVVFGDRSGGSPGFRMQTIAESAFEFRVSVDACATGQFRPLPDRLLLPVVAGPPETCVLVAPGRRRPGEPFGIGLRFEDRWGNPAVPEPHSLRLRADPGLTGLPDRIEVRESARTIGGLSAKAPGTFRVAAQDDAGATVAVSGPIVIEDTPLAGFWGDLHGQSGETVGIDTIREYMAFARDTAFLDVCGHQGNDFQITTPFWEEINRVTAELDRDGVFVVFPGYEWSGNTPVGGDHNVFFRHEGRRIRRSSHAMLADRSDIASDANTLPELFRALADEDCVLWSHVGGRPADVAHAHDPVLKTAVEVHSNWGTSEWILTDSLMLGHRVGVVGSSDGHKGRPGASGPGATEFGAYGGLTCFLAPELTRDGIFECMRRRHHYATSGSRMDLDVRARFRSPADRFPRDPRHVECRPERTREAMMGDMVRVADDEVMLAVRLAAASPIERVDVQNGTETLTTLRAYRAEDLGRRFRILWQGAEYRGRGRNTFWEGEIAVSGARIETLTSINRWNHERRLELERGRRIRFDAVTSGNFGGVDIVLDRVDGAAIEIRTNHVSGAFALDRLGLEDELLDAGGLERRIRLRRLPDRLTALALEASVPVVIAPDRDHHLWVRAATLDGHLAWSSPLYLWREPFAG